MATRMTITCKNCNNDFYIFWNGYNEDAEVHCPYCDCSLPKEYNRYIKSALGAAWELNYSVRSKHQDGLCDLFEFSTDEIFVPAEKFKSLKSE